MNDEYLRGLAHQLVVLSAALRKEHASEEFAGQMCASYIQSVLALASMNR